MARKIETYIKLQVPAAKANPSPPVGPALGQHGVNIMEFCKAFNAQTQGMEPGIPVPVVITAFHDKSHFTRVQNQIWRHTLPTGEPRGRIAGWSSRPNRPAVGPRYDRIVEGLIVAVAALCSARSST